MKKKDILDRKKSLEDGVAGVNRDIEFLQAKLQECITNRNATLGAIQECDHWLEEVEKEEKKGSKK